MFPYEHEKVYDGLPLNCSCNFIKTNPLTTVINLQQNQLKVATFLHSDDVLVNAYTWIWRWILIFLVLL